MIPFQNRFHGYSSLSYIYRKGRSLRSEFFTVKFIENKRRKQTRASVVVSKKIFKSAVKRNRIRRRIYEYIRLNLGNLNDIYDLVIIVNSSEVLNMPYKNLTHELANLLNQARLLK